MLIMEVTEDNAELLTNAQGTKASEVRQTYFLARSMVQLPHAPRYRTQGSQLG